MDHAKRRGPFVYVVAVALSRPSWAEKFSEGQTRILTERHRRAGRLLGFGGHHQSIQGNCGGQGVVRLSIARAIWIGLGPSWCGKHLGGPF